MTFFRNTGHVAHGHEVLLNPINASMQDDKKIFSNRLDSVEICFTQMAKTFVNFFF